MKLHPKDLILPASLLGGLMIILAVLLRGWAWEIWFPREAWFWELMLGGWVGLVGAGMIAWGSETLAPLQKLRDLVLDMLDVDQLRIWHALMFGLLAGIPEEIFFRGALQPLTHLLIASLIFGVLHAVTPLYAVYATLAGFLLGLLAAWRGNLWATTAAHTVYDAALFLFVIFRR